MASRTCLLPASIAATSSREAVADLFAAFRNADYFSLKDEYISAITDHPTVYTSIEFDGQKKAVKDYVGFTAGMPEIVDELERKIDRDRRDGQMDSRNSGDGFLVSCRAMGFSGEHS